MKKWLMAGGLGLLLGLAPAHAQMGENLRSEFHKQEELGAIQINSGELDKLKASLADPAIRVIALQFYEQDFKPELLEPILAWVRAGHTLWFYDARLGNRFGFKPTMLKRGSGHKPETGGFAGKKRDGVATTALAIGSHVINTGVGQVSAFLPKLTEQDEYGAVIVTADTQSLLRFKLDSPAIGALRREGRGLIVLKPLIWTEALSGDRFQSNLLEFSSGFQVPGPAGAGRLGSPPGPSAEYVQGNPAQPLVATSEAPQVTPSPSPSPTPDPKAVVASGGDEVEVVGEGKLRGTIAAKTLRFETGTSSVQLERNEIESLVIAAGPGELDTVVYRDGRKAKGWLIDKEVEFESKGESRKIEKRMLRSVRWGSPAPKPSQPQ